MGDADPVPERRPWWWRHQGMVLAVTTLVVTGALLSIVVRTRSGVGPSTEIDLESLLVLVVLAAAGALFPLLTRRWQIWVPECLLSIGAWALFLTSAGDLSCVDCSFALLIPFSAVGIQALLFVIALLVPGMRQHPDI